MSKLFNDLKESIGDMTKHAQGEHVQGITLNTVSIKPVPDMNSKDVKRIRTELGMSQGAFAAVIGVSKKTVEAWEAGTNVPSKPVIRLLNVLNSNKVVLFELIDTSLKQEPGMNFKKSIFK